jgi:hypothetical protein
MPSTRPTGIQKQRPSPRGMQPTTSPRSGAAVFVPITQHPEVYTTTVLSGVTQQTNTPTGADWTPWGATEQQPTRTSPQQEEKSTTPRKKITIEELLNKR